MKVVLGIEFLNPCLGRQIYQKARDQSTIERVLD